MSIHGSKGTHHPSSLARSFFKSCYLCRFLSIFPYMVHTQFTSSSTWYYLSQTNILSRTMLLYPLSPFFVLFCNVVATSDRRDFEMIKKITDDLRQFAKANASIGKLYGLFSKFLDLCTPLIKSNTGHPSISAAGSSSSSEPSNLNVMMLGRGDQMLDSTSTGVDLPSPIASTNRATPGVGVSQPMEGWDDSLMWELFDNQPSLGWAESELWDAMTQLSS